MALAYYEIFRSTSYDGLFSLIGTSISGSFQDTTAQPAITYYYKIRSVDSFGIRSSFSAVITSVPNSGSSSNWVPYSSRDLYETVSNVYGAFYEHQLLKNDYLELAHTSVVLINDEEAKLDLLKDFRDTQKNEAARQPTEVLRAVKSINSHVILQGGYASINEYLADVDLTICSSWAYLSGLAGYEIDDLYVRETGCLEDEDTLTLDGGDVNDGGEELYPVLDGGGAEEETYDDIFDGGGP